MKEPKPHEMDYYPRIKIANRWHLIVPETDWENNPHEGCEFHTPGVGEYECRLKNAHGDDSKCPTHERHDCGEHGTIFIRPSKWPEHRAHLVSQALEGKT